MIRVKFDSFECQWGFTEAFTLAAKQIMAMLAHLSMFNIDRWVSASLWWLKVQVHCTLGLNRLSSSSQTLETRTLCHCTGRADVYVTWDITTVISRQRSYWQRALVRVPIRLGSCKWGLELKLYWLTLTFFLIVKLKKRLFNCNLKILFNGVLLS